MDYVGHLGRPRSLLARFEVIDVRSFEQKSAVTRFAPPAWRRSVEALIPAALMNVLFRRFGLLLHCRARSRA